MSNLFKKVTSTVGAIAIAVSSVGATLTVSAASQFAPYADALATAGIIAKQSSEAGYRLGDNITRAEMAKIAVNMKKAEVKECTGTVYSDVTATLGDLCGYVEAAANAGIVSKANAKFRPMDLVTRAEMVKMLLGAMGIAPTTVDAGFKDIANTGDLAGFINAAAAAGIIRTADMFNPNNTATRGEAFKVASNAAGLTTSDVENTTGDDLNLGDLFGDLNGTGTTSTGTTSTGTTSTGVTLVGDMEVALNPASPAAQSVPYQGTVAFGKFDITAGSSADVSVNTINFVREGLGNRDQVNRVWMEKNGVRVTGRQSVGSDNTVIVSFSPALVIKAGSTESLDLIASLTGTTTGGQHKFTIAKSSDVVASAKVGGTFPISTATMTTAAYSVIPVDFTNTSTSSTYRVGDKNVELGQFKLYNGASDDKTATFKSITLRNDGSGDMSKNIANLAVYKAGAKVSTAVSFDGKKVTFALNDSIAFGRTETYYVRGDVESVDNTSGDNYLLNLQNSDDLNVVEATTGFKATINSAGVLDVATYKYSVNGGDIILSKSTTAPSSQTIAPGANDVVLLSADLKVAQAVNLQDLTLGWTGSGGVIFSSFKLKIGNNVVATYTPASTDTSAAFNGTFYVPANTTLQILGNVKSSLTSNYTFKFNDLSVTSFAIREYAANSNSIQPNQMVGSANAVSTTIGSATLTFTRNDGIADQKLAVGSNNVTLAQYSVKANDVSDVNLTKIKFTTANVASSTASGETIPATCTVTSGSYTGSLALSGGVVTSCTVNATSNITGVSLVVNGTTVSTKSMSSGSADFNDINVKITRNQDVTVKVVADFSTAIAGNFKLALAATDIEARDVNSTTLASSAMTGLPVNGVAYAFISAGSASLVINTSTPNAMVLTPGSNEVELARYTLGAQDDSLQLTDLYVKNTGTADLASRVKTIGLYDVAGNKLAVGSIVGQTVSFNMGNNSTFVVPKNTDTSVVVVKAAFNDITDAASSAGTVILTTNDSALTGAGYVNGTVNGVRLVSQSTGNAVTTITSGSVATAKTHLLVRSKAVIATTGVSSTDHTFTVTADANNRITLTGVTVNLSVTSSSTGTFIIYKDSKTAGNEVATGTISPAGVLSYTLPFVATEVGAGTSKTFYFETSGLTVATTGKRVLRITDFGFQDMMNTGGNVSVSSVKDYSNVGLPTAESSYQY